MGLFSKLFGNKANIIDDIANAKKQEAIDLLEREKTASNAAAAPAPGNSTSSPEGPSGFSWGPVMPAEENQYNFNGTYKEYFNDVFSKEFPAYRIETADANYGRATVFTFWESGQKVLVVELLSRKSSAYKLRDDCKKEKVPYLRFYYDYHGWWNTREYVKQRTQKALKG